MKMMKSGVGPDLFEAVHKGVRSPVNKHPDPIPCIRQSGSCSGGFLVILLCHCEGFSTHDHCSTEAAGQAVNCTSSLLVLFDKGAINCNSIILNCFIPMPGVSGVWLSPSGAALGDWPVPVRWPALPRLIRSSSRWWHCLPVPTFSPSCPLDSAGSPTRPGERPPCQSLLFVWIYSPPHYYLDKWPLISGQEVLLYPTFQTPY